MNGKNLRIEKFAVSRSNKLVETNSGVMILNNGSDKKYHIKDHVRDVWIQGIYPASQFVTKNTSHLVPSINLSSRFEEHPWTSLAHFDSNSFLLGPGVLSGTETFLPESGWREDDFGFALYNETSGNIDFSFSTTLSSPRAIFNGVPRNFYGLTPLNYNQFDFDLPEIFSDIFSCQNFLNLEQNTDGEINETENSAHLRDTRIYKKIGFNGSVLWASFKGGMTLSGSLSGETIPSGSSTHIDLVSSGWNDTHPVYSFDHVEIIRGLNISNVGVAHKSNIFSIELRNTNLNEAISDLEIRSVIQKIVERAIRKFVKAASPVHTTLWKIIWIGD